MRDRKQEERDAGDMSRTPDRAGEVLSELLARPLAPGLYLVDLSGERRMWQRVVVR